MADHSCPSIRDRCIFESGSDCKVDLSLQRLGRTPRTSNYKKFGSALNGAELNGGKGGGLDLRAVVARQHAEADEIGEGVDLHFLHDVSPVDFDRFRAQAEL